MLRILALAALIGNVSDAQADEAYVFRQRLNVLPGIELCQNLLSVRPVDHVGRASLAGDRLVGGFILDANDQNKLDLLVRVFDGVDLGAGGHGRVYKYVDRFSRKHRRSQVVAFRLGTNILGPVSGRFHVTGSRHWVEAHEAPRSISWHGSDVSHVERDADERPTAVDTKAGFNSRRQLQPSSVLSNQGVEFLTGEVGLPRRDPRRERDYDHARNGRPEGNPVIPIALMLASVAAIAWGLFGLLLERPEGAWKAARQGLAVVCGFLGLSAGTLLFLLTVFQT
eukprot:TRINITY_DN10141_c0_g1_i2.p1 TRINITY_DN10141_c0_g1~~TRINITY_DN10141_c0_g1_i2.p1  ORF type:complete len:282 (+),score=-22.81 TRINITY_DN10141_c0_g1_i2:20-865(+)